MAGMMGFNHNCKCEKVNKLYFKKSIRESPFSHAQIDMIWDFYVTHAIGGESGLKREVSDYGWDRNNNKFNGFLAIEQLLFNMSHFEKICFIRSTTCKDTLSAMGMFENFICIEHSRAVLLQNYTIEIDENENVRYKSNGSSESKIQAFFRHIRNSLAHGNTYFFDNGTMLLEDKDRSKTTAAILIRQQSLLDWIAIIDKNKKHYILQETGTSRNSK